MNRKLLEELTCPLCGGFPLRLSGALIERGDGKVESGDVVCDAGHSFPLVDYVLDLVCAGGGAELEGSAMYDDMWDAHVVQIYQGREAEYQEKFRNDTGLLGDLAPTFDGARVCDAGCGEGRYTFLASALGADHVVAIDYARHALERAVRGTGNPTNCSFVRADLRALPLRPVYDYVFGFGTLHHTPNTRASFDAIAALVRNEGMLSVYVYASGGLPRIYPAIRPITRRLSRTRVRRFAEDWGFGYAQACRADVRAAFRRLGRFDILGIGAVTFEGLTTPYIRGHRRSDVERWFREAGFEVLASSDLVTVTGRRVSS